MKGDLLFLGSSVLAEALKAEGRRVLTVHHREGADLRLNHPFRLEFLLEKARGTGFEPAALFYCDDGNLPMLLDPFNAPFPALFYSIDTYCNPWHCAYARGFDLALVAQKDFLPLFTDFPASWLPLFCAGSEPCQGFGERDIPVAFVGTLGHKNNPDRLPFLNGFKKLAPLAMLSGDFRPIFARARIALNQTAFGEVNFRCFEAMACGAALLMEDCGNGLSDIFTPGENILPLYRRGDSAGAAKIAGEFLAQPEKLAAIAENGRKLVLEGHSARARAASLERILENLQWRPRLARARERAMHVGAAFMMLASELGPEMRNYAGFYMRQGENLQKY